MILGDDFMAKKQFQSESKRLLDLMINSIYTNKDIFLRELISNASDALDKLSYRSLTDKNVKVKKDDLEINLSFDKEKRLLVVEDNGCGMTKEELEDNLGTIAKSGSLSFKENMTKEEKTSIIGQFGVGFYSAFMVSDKITVLSRSVDSEDAYLWESEGADGYEIKKDKVVIDLTDNTSKVIQIPKVYYYGYIAYTEDKQQLDVSMGYSQFINVNVEGVNSQVVVYYRHPVILIILLVFIGISLIYFSLYEFYL
jgi:HSP90 family molecular chaperone